MRKKWVLWLVNVLALMFLSFSVYNFVAADVNTTLSLMIPVSVIVLATTAAAQR